MHAEVQMVVHYMLDKNGGNYLNPRAIGTSKSACFLCGRFLAHYGDLFTGRYHNRLYDQWTVPRDLPLDDHQADRMDRVLTSVRGDVRSLLKRNRKGHFLYPAESIVSSRLPATALTSSASLRAGFAAPILASDLKALKSNGSRTIAQKSHDELPFAAGVHSIPRSDTQKPHSPKSSGSTVSSETAASILKSYVSSISEKMGPGTASSVSTMAAHVDHQNAPQSRTRSQRPIRSIIGTSTTSSASILPKPSSASIAKHSKTDSIIDVPVTRNLTDDQYTSSSDTQLHSPSSPGGSKEDLQDAVHKYNLTWGHPQTIITTSLHLVVEIEEPRKGSCLVRKNLGLRPGFIAEQGSLSDIIDIDHLLPGQEWKIERPKQKPGDSQKPLELRLMTGSANGDCNITALDLRWTE